MLALIFLSVASEDIVIRSEVSCLKKIAILLMIITVLSKIIGFSREIFLSYLYGASNISDAYIIATTIPSVLFGFVTTALTASYIPIYNKVYNIEGEVSSNSFTNNLLNLLIIATSVIILIGVIFTKPIVLLFASGFTGNTLELAISFTRITLFSLYFIGIVSILRAYLQIKDQYIIPALIGLPLNFFLIVSIFISSIKGELILAYGYIFATFSQVILMLPLCLKKGYKYKFYINVYDKNIRHLLYIILPLILGASVNQINILIDRTIASNISIGGISALNYASKLNGFIQGIFVLSISTVMYPIISKMAANKNVSGLTSILTKSIVATNLLVLPSTIGSMVFSAPIVQMLFGRGAFNETALEMTSSALFFYSIGMIGFGLREVLSRAFYSLQDTKTPMINASIGMILNVILNIVLSKFLGIGGLALATSISAIFTTVLLFISLRKKVGPFGMKQISFSFLKILFASLVMGSFAKLSFNFLTASFSQNLSLLLAIGVGAVSYFVIIYFMKIEDVDVFVGAVKKKIGRGTA